MIRRGLSYLNALGLVCVAVGLPQTASASTEYQKMLGRWFSDTTTRVANDDRITIRLCGTEEFSANGTSRLRAEIIMTVADSDKGYGVIASILFASTSGERVERGVRLSTSIAGDSHLNEFIPVVDGRRYKWDELPEQYHEYFRPMKRDLESPSFWFTQGEVSKSVIKSISNSEFVEETLMNDGSAFVAVSRRTDHIIDRCQD